MKNGRTRNGRNCLCDKQTLNSEGWEFSCPYNLIGSLPESLTQGLLIGKLLIGGLGVIVIVIVIIHIYIYIYTHVYIYIYIYIYTYVCIYIYVCILYS